METKFLQELVAFMQQKGFIWGPEPEIYGGLAGFYTYAPLGKLLKNNVEGLIRRTFQLHNFWEVECPTVMPKPVWEASGHLGGFSDPVIACSKCKAVFRVDNLLGDLFPDLSVQPSEYLDFIKKKDVKCPSCKGDFKLDIKQHNLMMKTTVGMDIEAYNRPETATTTYLPYPRFYDFFRKKLPFAVFQIGKAYRNELSPRQHLMRCREFTQAEAQIFLFKEQKNDYAPYKRIKAKKVPLWSWQLQDKQQKPVMMSVEEAMKKGLFKNQAYAYMVYLAYHLFETIGIPADKIRLRQHGPDEKAFYADDAWDIELRLQSFGWFEVCGVHDRTDYDLTQHAKFSGVKLEALKEEGGKEVPHVLEIAFGTDRPTFALLDLFYVKKNIGEGKSILAIPAAIAPVKAAVFPLSKKEPLLKTSMKIYDELMELFLVKYDQSGSIGKRYLRAAEEGVPYAITADFDSVDDKSVTIRDRDSEKQKRIKIEDVSKVLSGLVKGELKFRNL